MGHLVNHVNGMLKDQTQHPLPGAAQTTLSRGTPLEALLSVLMAHSEEWGPAQGRSSEFGAGGAEDALVVT